MARPLVVDLDGTLLSSDLMLECWFAMLSVRPAQAIAALAALRRGPAAFKAAVADFAPEPETLPWNPEVIALIEARRAAGDRIVLATAADRAAAEKAVAHLGIIDEVIGSEGGVNLKGAAKAKALVERFGEGGFDYAGDSAADLPVWSVAHEAITVGAPPSLRRRAERAARGRARHLDAPSGGWLRALRPHQWLKNLLIFLPLVAAHGGSPAGWAAAALAFVAFSMAASGVYLLNDLLDLASDRAHPRKRNRPMASGALGLATGALTSPALVAGALAISAAALPGRFLLALALYLALTTTYSFWLKRKLVIDICALAGLYTLRVLAGGLAAGVWLSPWLLALSIFLFLSLAAVKRQAELVGDAKDGREGSPGRAYVVGDLPIVSGVALASGYAGVVVLALYVSSPAVAALYAAPQWLWGACPVLLYWVTRTVMLAHRGWMADDPVVYAIRDRVSHACLALILGFAAAATWGTG